MTTILCGENQVLTVPSWQLHTGSKAAEARGSHLEDIEHYDLEAHYIAIPASYTTPPFSKVVL